MSKDHDGRGSMNGPRRSPFMIGMIAAFGVAVAYGLIELIIGARSVLIIIGLALFIAAGLDPVVGWLVRHRMPPRSASPTGTTHPLTANSLPADGAENGPRRASGPPQAPQGT